MRRTQKPLSKRAKAHRRHLRRDPFGRLAVAVGDYLESIGWSAVLVGTPRIQQPGGERPFNYEFVVRFAGGEKKQPSLTGSKGGRRGKSTDV